MLRKTHALIACLVLVLCSIPPATRITLEEDITALLPSDGGAADSATTLADLARGLGLMSKVLIVLGPVKPAGDKKLQKTVDRLTGTIEKMKGVGSVVSRSDAVRDRRSVEVILRHAARLHRPDLPNAKLESIDSRLADLKMRLASPEAMVIGPYLAQDPLGITRQTLRGLEAQAVASGTTTEAGLVLSADKTSALLVLELDFDPFELSKSQAFVAALDQKIRDARASVDAEWEGPGIEITPLGGVYYVVANAGSTKKDISRAFAATSVLVVFVFFLLFGRIRTLPIALVPGGLGIGVALGLFGALGYPLHPLTLGFAATITGMSVDYAIHLLYRANTAEASSSEARMRLALAHTARPIVLGCLTTVGAFLLVGTSSFTGIRQMALFSAISIPVAMCVTLLGLPAFHGFLASREGGNKTGLLARVPLNAFFGRVSSRVGFRVVTIALFLVLALIGLIFAQRVVLSGDPQDLGSSNPVLEQRVNLVKRAFPALLEQVHLVVTAPRLEDALRENDALYKRLIDAGILPERVISLSPFLPSLATQQRSHKAIFAYLYEGDKGDEVRAAFRNAGFTEQYYASLKDSLKIPPITPKSYEDTSLFPLINDSLKVKDDRVHVVTRVRAGGEEEMLALERIAEENPSWQIASERLETRRVLELFQKELARMLLTWMAVTLLVLSALERSIWYGIKAILPALFGLLASVAFFAAEQRALTPVASAGLTLVLGLGIDYGLFMQNRKSRMRDSHLRSSNLGSTGTAIIASALTTLAAFGVLGFAATRAMADMGIIILVGVSGSLLAALGLLPALNIRRPE